MKTLIACSWVVTTFLFVSLTFAGVWEEDFDAGEPDGWTAVVGKWAVEKGEYVEQQGPAYAKLMFGDIEWTDYSIEVDVTVGDKASCNCLGLLVRADETGDNAMRFWIRTDQWKCQVSRWKPGNVFEHIADQIELDIKSGKTYHLRVIAEGKNYQYFVDGEKVFDDKDPQDSRQAGRIGFIAHQTNPRFDNLRIEGDDIPPSAVDAKGKLATFWSRVKVRSK